VAQVLLLSLLGSVKGWLAYHYLIQGAAQGPDIDRIAIAFHIVFDFGRDILRSADLGLCEFLDFIENLANAEIGQFNVTVLV
jgi:hypothetical protein